MNNMETVLKHYGKEITDVWSEDCQWYIYEEQTSDGYTIHISTSTPNHISVNEDVYYYENDLKDTLQELIKEDYFDHIKKIYIDDKEAYYVEEAIQELSEIIQDEIDQSLPEWFNGQIYDEGDTVTNSFTGVQVKLNNVELSIYDFIIGSTLVMELQGMKQDDLLEDYKKALNWFQVNNAEAYMKLID
jgi:hypothetical protein